MTNGDPILVACTESDVRMVDLPLSHFVGPIVYLDPPLAAIGSTQVPLVTNVHTFCFCRLKAAAHSIEHFLRCRIHITGCNNHCCAEETRDSKLTDGKK